MRAHEAHYALHTALYALQAYKGLGILLYMFIKVCMQNLKYSEMDGSKIEKNFFILSSYSPKKSPQPALHCEKIPSVLIMIRVRDWLAIDADDASRRDVQYIRRPANCVRYNLRSYAHDVTVRIVRRSP